MREYLKNLAFFYQGDHRKIKHALKRNEQVPNYFSTFPYVTILDDKYPEELKDLYDPPFVLFYQGNLTYFSHPKVGVIGSRRACSYSLRETSALVRQIKKDFVIVSGLAYGIDSGAHQEAMNEKTIAVLANGLDHCYPKEHQSLQKKISQDHLIISEYPEGCRPKPYRFPIRNRIIAGLSKKIFVMSAAITSGSMHTANTGLEIGREIHCLPHRLDNKNGQGCNYLIQDGAQMLTKRKDLFNI